mmetsp:Transcript_18854/g.35150  ORF Transcript_18854/g.35150 Transcript_18854/m.35150 type:complete len:333 (+) Transcript_18854:221-1219(+)
MSRSRSSSSCTISFTRASSSRLTSVMAPPAFPWRSFSRAMACACRGPTSTLPSGIGTGGGFFCASSFACCSPRRVKCSAITAENACMKAPTSASCSNFFLAAVGSDCMSCMASWHLGFCSPRSSTGLLCSLPIRSSVAHSPPLSCCMRGLRSSSSFNARCTSSSTTPPPAFFGAFLAVIVGMCSVLAGGLAEEDEAFVGFFVALPPPKNPFLKPPPRAFLSSLALSLAFTTSSFFFACCCAAIICSINDGPSSGTTGTTFGACCCCCCCTPDAVVVPDKLLLSLTLLPFELPPTSSINTFFLPLSPAPIPSAPLLPLAIRFATIFSLSDIVN